MGRWMKKIKNKQYGQAMAEFALTIPIFMILIFGIIELSRFFLIYSSVYTASREATRYATAVGDFSSPQYLNCAGIEQMAIGSGWFGGITTDDIDIHYESTPGTNEGECGGTYVPVLGDRVVVEIDTTYRPILGIIPEMPIQATNGRTILMGIEINATPIARDLCDAHVSYVSTTYAIGDEVGATGDPDEGVVYKTLSLQIQNTSENASFKVYEINNIDWIEETYPTVVLARITWDDKVGDGIDGEKIWPQTTGETYTLPFNVANDYFRIIARTIGPQISGVPTVSEIEFFFTEPSDFDAMDISGLGLTFNLVMQNTSLPTDFCNPVN